MINDKRVCDKCKSPRFLLHKDSLIDTYINSENGSVIDYKLYCLIRDLRIVNCLFIFKY